MRKRGISPLIAVVLIIGFTVAIAAVIMTWGTGFVRTMQKTTEEAAERELTLAVEATLEIRKAELVGDEIRLTIENTGSVEIDSIKVRIYGSDGIETLDTASGLEAYGIGVFVVPFVSSKVGAVEKVEAMPVIEYGGEMVVCSNCAGIEKVEPHPYILKGENEKISNHNRCSPDLYVLENNKIKFFVSAPTIKDGSCSAGSYNTFAGVPMRIWTKNSNSSSYRINQVIIDDSLFDVGKGWTTVDSVSNFVPMINSLEVNFNQQGNLKPKVRYTLMPGNNYVKVELSATNVGSSTESVQLRWYTDNDYGGTWRTAEGSVWSGSALTSDKWIAGFGSQNDILARVIKDSSFYVKIHGTYEEQTVGEDSATSLAPRQIHTMTFYIMSDFKGPSGYEWKPVEDLYNSL